MSDFVSVLESVERARAERSASRPPSFLLHRTVTDSAARTTAGWREAVVAYVTSRPNVETDPRAAMPDLGALRRAIATADGDARTLHVLRRHAARALHPDRGGDGAALAECNALIDTALRTPSRKRT